MRILMLNHEFTITGSSKAFFKLASALNQLGHSITVVPANPEPGPIKYRFEALGIPVSQQVRLKDFDLAIANTIATGQMIEEISRDIPIIWFINEGEIAVDILSRHPAVRQALNHASAIIFNTESQRATLHSFIHHLPHQRINVCPFGVSVDMASIAHDRVPPKTAALRIVQVGTIEGRKRPQDLIWAAAALQADIECVICGKYYYLPEDAAETVKNNPDRFKLVENLTDDEVAAWIASADIVCLASYSETQALAVYEAALLERPLVLSDLTCYEGVFVHGENCLKFPAGNVNALAAMLAALVVAPNFRQEIGIAARKAALPYNDDAFLAKFNAVVQSVTQRSIYLP